MRGIIGVVFDLTGKTALVTGAGQFVGAGIARSLADQGAHVLVNDLLAERAESVAEKIVSAGGTAAPLPFDVTDTGGVVKAVRRSGPVDILVNNAGNGGAERMRPTRFAEMDPGDWKGPIDVNLYGVMNCCHAVVAAMVERGWGRIVTISSGAGTVGVGIGVAPYSAGKGGGIGFMRSLALETAASGVTCNTVALGLMANVAGGDAVAHLERTVPVKRLGTPEDVGAICVYLSSDEAAWTTGQTIGVNGGSATS